jgi:3-methyladenine DNA glycosylase/8-oxoguanine DNA glycosylase
LRPGAPLDLAGTLRRARRGGTDPTMRLADGWCWRASHTAAGPATVHLRTIGGEVEASAWGAGAEAALDAVPALLGLDDDGGFPTRTPHLAELARRFAGVRNGRTGDVCPALTASILEQKVTGTEARRSWAWLVRRLGQPAPGPVGLRLPPTPAALAATPSWVFHQANVERKRADTVRRAMSVAHRLAPLVDEPLAEAHRRLEALPGVGRWTAAEVATVALGDPDAVSVGDFHLKNIVAWALAREPRGTDERMLELLEPWRGDRGRVVRLLVLGGARPPRYGPRLAPKQFAHL